MTAVKDEVGRNVSTPNSPQTLRLSKDNNAEIVDGSLLNKCGVGAMAG